MRFPLDTRWCLVRFSGAMVGWAFWFWSVGVLQALPEQVQFNKHIRPILSDSCFYCHGPDEKHREAKLRLDTREGATALHDGVRAISPGKPEESELLARVLTHDIDEVMPPPSSKKARISEEQVALLRRWIEQGAPYEGHWAFLPLQNAPLPRLSKEGWARNPVDLWVGKRLEMEGVAPSPEADRATLLRRVSLDLTGLLPTPEEVKGFVSDPNPDAYRSQVERLLASPHYGERWGRHWLDQARYADTNGYTIDGERAMWPYRDWVIRSLNADMPFDQFTIEQIAGDLLPSPTKSQRIATAFHRNTLINEEGGTKPEQFRVEAVVDRVNTTGAVWLGLTLGCAQCHSHKFDPISQREYYQMFAFFNQSADVNNKGPTLEVARGEVFGAGPSAEERRAALAKAREEEQRRWEVAQRSALVPSKEETSEGVERWEAVRYLEYDTANNAGFRLLPDNSLLADGAASFNDRYRVVAAPGVKRVGAVRLRVLPHESLPQKGPGLAGNGNFVLTHFTVSVGGRELPIRSAQADHEQPGYPAAAAIDGLPKSGWAINVAKGSTVRMNAEHQIVFVLEEPVVVGETPLEFHLHHDLNENYLIGRFALEVSEGVAKAQKREQRALEAWQSALLVEPQKRSAEEEKAVRSAFEMATKVAAQKEKDPEIAELMVMQEVEKRRPTYLFKRGDFLAPDEARGPLEAGVLECVQAAMGRGQAEGVGQSGFRSRLDLAKWLVDASNPLTPRVTVNRVWMRYFGRGIVETEEDFGSQGSVPTHPELLDWLAGEFVRKGWSLKELHRTIVLSATYRQASKARPDLAEKDPRNLWLARQERLRLEAEILRDAALSASGLLHPEIGGPGVRPPQPAGVYSFTQNARAWVAHKGPDRYRRGMYTTFIRSAPHPLFTTFDVPDFQSVCTRRARSNTPLQALTMANDEAFFEMAQGLAERVIREVGATEGEEAWVRRASELCLSREPSAKEGRLLKQYYQRQVEAFAQKAGAAQPLVSGSLQKLGVPMERAAAMVAVARVLLNTDAFVTRE